MLDSKNKLALILGGGELVETLIFELRKKKQNKIIIAIKNSYEFYNKHPPDYQIRFDNLGKVFSILKKNKINKVLILGRVKKVKLLSIRPDLITLIYLLKIIFYYNKGDGQLLNKIINIFSKKNITVLDSRLILKDHLANKKKLNFKLYSKYINKKKALKYFNVCKNFGYEDKGQCIIMNKNNIILAEDKNGTDFLINKFKKYNLKGKSFLIKTSKPQQDLNIDLPTIGPNTIKNMYAANISGLIVESKKTFIYKQHRTYYLMKKYKMFYYAV